MSTVNSRSELELALEARIDLDRYRSNKRLVFAAQVLLGIEDIHAVAADSLTDGPGDKSCDFVHVDRDAGMVVLAQGYEATAKRVVKEVKAQSLLHAVDWLLSKEPKGLPIKLESAILSARAAIEEGEIRHLKIWFVHNLDVQPQIRDALTGAGDAARNALDARYPNVAAEIKIESLEVSAPYLTRWYQSYTSPILVKEEMRIPWTGGQQLSGPGWTAIQTALPMRWLAEQFWSHRDSLFSANVRGYLGKINHANNINSGIRRTLREEPENFYIYNNGITALVEYFEIGDDGEGQGWLTIKGLSIVNGAQTTGALQGIEEIDLDRAFVNARFIRCSNQQIVEKIIKRSNRQNSVTVEDFRSRDRVQVRLEKELSELGVTDYVPLRRGGSRDSIRRVETGAVRADYAARALVSFHGNPIDAYYNPAKIWEDDSLYRQHFNEDTSARHLLLCWGLGKAIERRRQELHALTAPNDSKRQQLEFLDRRGANWLLISAIAGCAKVLVEGYLANLFRLEIVNTASADEATKLWCPVVETVMYLVPRHLGSLLQQGSRWKQLQLEQARSDFEVAALPLLEDRDDLGAAFRDAVHVRV